MSSIWHSPWPCSASAVPSTSTVSSGRLSGQPLKDPVHVVRREGPQGLGPNRADGPQTEQDHHGRVFVRDLERGDDKG